MLLSVTDAENAITRYESDNQGNRTKTIDPLLRETVMSYDSAGNMTSLTDPAAKMTRWEYDLAGRVTKVIDAAGGETRYVYEPGGCTGAAVEAGAAGCSPRSPSPQVTRHRSNMMMQAE